MSIKSILKSEYKERLLADEELLGRLGKRLGVQSQTLRISLNEDRQTLMLPHKLIEIRSVLEVPDDMEIIDIVTEETHLQE